LAILHNRNHHSTTRKHTITHTHKKSKQKSVPFSFLFPHFIHWVTTRSLFATEW
jgi:hypothetical protein